MAEKESKNSFNILGPYYVDDQCIACDACVMEAPDFFEMNEDEGLAFVKKSPITPEEIDLCESALETCPVGAIGNDGTS